MEYSARLAGRRSTRRFDTGRDVPDDVLERVLAAPLAMPHAGNTYDWRGVVLRRRDRDPVTWPAVHDSLLGQSYVEEAAVLVAFAVQPTWWAERYRANIAALVDRGLIDPARHRGLLAMVESGPGDAVDLATGLIGEAMMGVAAAMLAALDAGLGATVTACRPEALAPALGLPDSAVLCPWGVLALGWPAAEALASAGGSAAAEAQATSAPSGASQPEEAGDGRTPAAAPAAPKPGLDEMYFVRRWGRPRATPVP
jgi:nitroreductase